VSEGSGRVPWRDVGRSLRNPNVRRYLIGQGVSNSGKWLEQTAELWLLLQLTGSGIAVGLHSVMLYGPILLFGAYGGVISDRVNRRHLLIATQSLQALATGTLALFTFAGSPSVLLVYSLVLTQGLIGAVDNPLRRAFIRDIASDDEIANAVSLHATTATLARISGPALAGFLIAGFGLGWCFLLNTVSFGAVLISLFTIEPDRMRPSEPVRRRRGQLREGLAYAWRHRDVRVTLLLAIGVSIFAWNWQIVLPVYSTVVLDGNAALFGTLVALLSLGSLAGAIVTARKERLGERHLRRSAAALAFALIATSLAPTMLVAIIGLIGVGAAGTSFIIGSQARLQLSVDDVRAGRVLALYSVGFMGSKPLGGLYAGIVIDWIGSRAAFGIGGGAVLLFVAALMVSGRRRRRDRLGIRHGAGEET